MTRGDDSTDLRKNAEKIARKKAAPSQKKLAAMQPDEIKQMLHELQVHEIEVEMQNEGLRLAGGELKSSQERYFDLYDLAPVGYLTVSEKGLILEANLTAATLLGIRKSNLANHPLSRFISKEDQNIYYLHRKQLFETGDHQKCELRMLKKDETAFWALLTMTVVQDAEGAPKFHIIITDITERKRMETALKESEELFRNYLEYAPDGVYMSTVEGTFLYGNRKCEEIIGYQREELIGKNFLELNLLPEKSLNKAAQLLQANMEGKPTGPDEIELILKDGRLIPVEINTSVVQRSGEKIVLAFVRDITERKLAEEVLQESEANFHRSLDESPLGIRIGTAEGETLYANRVILDFYGYDSIEEFKATPVEKRYTKESFAEYQIRKEKRERGDYSPSEYEISIIRKDREVRHLQVFRKETLWNGKRQHQIIYQDITDRKFAEEALQKSEERYRELSIVDDLTSLYNSRHFYVQLNNETERSNRYGQPLTLLLLDLDNFKIFNDTYGHVEGNQVLSRLGQVIKRCLRHTDSAYRYGGEEFTVILPMTTGKVAAITAERIRTEFKKETFSLLPGQDVHLTMSIGLGQYNPQEDIKTFVHRVDQLMYQAKKNGKDRVCSETQF